MGTFLVSLISKGRHEGSLCLGKGLEDWCAKYIFHSGNSCCLMLTTTCVKVFAVLQ